MVSLSLDPTVPEFDETGIADYWWPVSIREVNNVRESLSSQLPPVIRRATQTSAIGVPLQAYSYLIPRFSCAMYTGLALRRRANEAGYEIVPNQGSTILSPVAMGEVPASTPIVDEIERAGSGYSRRWSSYPRQIKWSLEWNGLNPRGFVPPRYFDGIVATQPTNMLLYKRAVHSDDPIVYWSAGQILDSVGSSLPRTPMLSTADKRVIDNVTDVVEKSFESAGETMPTRLREYVGSWLEAIVRTIMRYVGALRDWRKLPANLWIGSGLRDTLLAMAVQLEGGKVTIHDHAGGSQFLCPTRKAATDFEFVDEVVTYNDRMASLLKDGVDPSILIRGDVPKIYGFSASGLRRPTKLPQNTILDGSLEPIEDSSRVMYVAHHYLQDGDPVVPALTNLDWHYRLLSHLKQLGYSLKFKPHPESPFSVAEPFERNLEADVLNQPFESVTGAADAFVFTELTTSTLPTALWSNKPIVVVDFDLPYMTDQNRELLSGRCRFVEGRISDDNRLYVDADELDTALRAAHEHDETEFLREYLTVDEVKQHRLGGRYDSSLN